MRRGYRNKPIFGMVFWTLVLGGTAVYTAWKFEWFSIDFADLVAQRTEADDRTGNNAHSPNEDRTGEDLKRGVAVDAAVFTQQREPADEPIPESPIERRTTDSEAAARLRLLQQRQPLEGSGFAPSNKPAAPETSESLPQTEFPRSAATEPQLDRPAVVDANETRHSVNGAAIVPGAGNAAVNSRVIQASNEEPAGARPAAVLDGKYGGIDELLDKGDTLGAHRELSKLYWGHPDSRAELLERIERTAEIIYFSPQPHFIEPYVVQEGDQFAKFAKTYNVPWQYLARLNRVDPQRIRPGQKLKVIRGPFSAVVDLGRYELTIHAYGYFVRRFEVGIGKQGTSPVGKFKVLEKVMNPQYTDPEGRVVDADDPANPLGERWIDLGDGYGIHGTIEPDSIGKAESRGCIRLRNRDVEDVYDLLGVGSEVVIRP